MKDSHKIEELQSQLVEVIDMEDEMEPAAAPIDTFVSHFLKFSVTH